MNYQDTKKQMMDSYPTLFVDEADVLHHLFAVNGNGYGWCDGELVDECDDNNREFLAARRKMHNDETRAMIKRFSDLGNTEYAKTFEDMIESDDPEVERAKEVARRAKRAAKGEPYDSKLYPLCQYADILHVPKDVKPDWLIAATKALVLFSNGRYKVTNEDTDWLLKALKNIDSITKERGL